tara:strand:+ start:691 stop:960 length:270 start_codon:yes stop_codon:yes gene_type:complete
MTIQINRLLAANETQAATIARLERERDQAQVLAELAKPEAREWRVLAEDHSQCFASEAEANAAADWLRTNDAGNVYVDSRTVGPWERAE